MKRLMVLFLAVVVVLMTSSARAADEARLIKGITCTYETALHEIGNPDHTKLLNGKDAPMLWYPSPPRQNAANIDFDLGNTYRVTCAEVDLTLSDQNVAPADVLSYNVVLKSLMQ